MQDLEDLADILPAILRQAAEHKALKSREKPDASELPAEDKEHAKQTAVMIFMLPTKEKPFTKEEDDLEEDC